MSSSRIPFTRSPRPTLGVEIELQILDPESRNLRSASLDILKRLDGNSRIKQELTQSTIEVITGVCEDVAGVRRDLSASIATLYQIGEEIGVTFASAGTHPFAQWREQAIYPDARYRRLVETIQWPARRLIIYGLHVHVGVESGEKAIAICNAMTRFIPHLLALSASSPYIDFEDTGLASVRAKIFDGMPTAGLPFRLANYSGFQSFMNALLNAGAIQSIREIWWDIRPHPGFGTLEVRICDAPSTLGEICALAALVQCLVVWLSEGYDHGEMPELLAPWIIRENKWRATRFGLDADVIIDNAGTRTPVKTDLERTLNTLRPFGERLRCATELRGIERVLDRGASYERQRTVYGASHDFKEVVQSLVSELKREVLDAG